MHALQNLIVALLVPGCGCYAAWKLMPSVARRSLAGSILRIPHLPRQLESSLRKTSQAATGCGCDGCDHAGKLPATNKGAAAPTQQPITFHPRAQR
jgi:hypothetical protein